MPLWRKLYAVVWLNFAALLLVLMKDLPLAGTAHAVIGIIIIMITVHNRQALQATAAPERIKRIAKVMIGMSIFAGVTGLLLGAPLHGWVHGLVKFLHITAISALFTQSSSVATTFDMWQEKEFLPPNS